MKKHFVCVALVLCCLPSVMSAQDFESFEEFKRRSKKEFKEFVDKENADFAEMLREKWVAFETMKSEQKKRIEPKEPVKYIPPSKMETPVEIKIEKPTVDVPKVEPMIVPPRVTPPKIEETGKHPVFSFDFYGQTCKVHIPLQFKFRLRSTDENAISSSFEDLAKSDYKGFINECLAWKQKLGLNDWYYKLFVDQLTGQFYEDKANEQTIAEYFIFVQSGYNLKIGRCDQNLILMLPFNETLYGRSYLNIEGIYYYLFGNKSSQIYTYKTMPKTGRNFSVQLNKELNFAGQLLSKEVSLVKQNTKFVVVVNNSLRSLMTDYPQCDVVNYAQAPLSSAFRESLIPQLVRLVEGKNKEQAANLLINFVQNSFQYKTDPEQFGYERPLFAEELFIYPFSDCEDRSVLFSQLVRNILNLEVVLLDYPDHISTAVNFGDEAIKGDCLLIEGKRYLVCDPTYINAPIGSTMPQYKGVSPKVWKIASK